MPSTEEAMGTVRCQPAATMFGSFAWRVAACHLVTYFVAGVLAYTLFNYKQLFETGPLSALMRPVSSKWVAAGPALQVFRGLMFALVLYPFRRVFLDGRLGWLKLWGLFLGLAILGTAGPPPGSFEGAIYTKLTLIDHLRVLPEVVLQTLALSLLLVAWCRRPGRAWTVAMALASGAVLLMSMAGALIPRPDAFR